MIIIIMGAAGAGKTTVGTALARQLGWRFIEADDLHSPENIRKMRQGTALSHGDRVPWLGRVRVQIEAAHDRGESIVVACSSLTHEYRDILSTGLPAVRFVYLRAEADLLEERLRQRRGHFAGPGLVSSQLATLEAPDGAALTLDATAPVDVLVSSIRSAWQL